MGVESLGEGFGVLRLKRNEERRIRRGHPWVYSNEVDTKATPLKALQPGDPVLVEDFRGKAIGTGYANPASLICARLVSRDVAHPFGGPLLSHRVNLALGLRERLFSRPFYRLVFGESDGLPGLVVDRYGEVLVVQISTAGMERQRELIVDALLKRLKPAAVVLRNDVDSRSLEGLESKVEVVHGSLPDTLLVEEGGAHFEVPTSGQKTGWFYDQRDNRLRAARYCSSARVLDVFSYAGGFGVQAARAGAASVLCVDSSAKALEQVAVNAALNDVADRVTTRRGDAFDVLRDLRGEGAQFDVVMVDPPAFVRRRKDAKEGELAYRRVNEAAMRLLDKDGVIVASSCSFHLQRETLVRLLFEAARHLGRSMQVLEQGFQAQDHPIHPGMPESAYLKTVIARLVRD